MAAALQAGPQATKALGDYKDVSHAEVADQVGKAWTNIVEPGIGRIHRPGPNDPDPYLNAYRQLEQQLMSVRGASSERVAISMAHLDAKLQDVMARNPPLSPQWVNAARLLERVRGRGDVAESAIDLPDQPDSWGAAWGAEQARRGKGPDPYQQAVSMLRQGRRPLGPADMGPKNYGMEDLQADLGKMGLDSYGMPVSREAWDYLHDPASKLKGLTPTAQLLRPMDRRGGLVNLPAQEQELQRRGELFAGLPEWAQAHVRKELDQSHPTRENVLAQAQEAYGTPPRGPEGPDARSYLQAVEQAQARARAVQERFAHAEQLRGLWDPQAMQVPAAASYWRAPGQADPEAVRQLATALAGGQEVLISDQERSPHAPSPQDWAATRAGGPILRHRLEQQLAQGLDGMPRIVDPMLRARVLQAMERTLSKSPSMKAYTY